jgi:hypothetical protein
VETRLSRQYPTSGGGKLITIDRLVNQQPNEQPNEQSFDTPRPDYIPGKVSDSVQRRRNK